MAKKKSKKKSRRSTTTKKRVRTAANPSRRHKKGRRRIRRRRNPAVNWKGIAIGVGVGAVALVGLEVAAVKQWIPDSIQSDPKTHALAMVGTGVLGAAALYGKSEEAALGFGASVGSLGLYMLYQGFANPQPAPDPNASAAPSAPMPQLGAIEDLGRIQDDEMAHVGRIMFAEEAFR